MKKWVENDLAERTCRLFGAIWQPERMRTKRVSSDGSLRRFCRILLEDGTSVIGIAPPADDVDGLREARSGWLIGSHLFAAGVPVPEPYAFDEQSGLLVCEDMGDVRLHDILCRDGENTTLITELYRRVVVELARMQVAGRKDFDCSWCWDTPCYDRRLMLERESGYFLQALCKDFLQLSVAEQDLQKEFAALADCACRADASFFLHRDFQSRNIMVHQGRIRFIDFQGGRLGPAGYDLASLLIDPYAALPRRVQTGLLELYLDAFTSLVEYDRQRFRAEYLVLALQRNLQILGAFAYLSNCRRKPFFRQYIRPSLVSLQTLLAKTGPDEYSYLKIVTDQCVVIFDRDSSRR